MLTNLGGPGLYLPEGTYTVVVGVGAADYEVSQGDTLSEIAARTGVRAPGRP